MVILSDFQQPTTLAHLLINHHGCCEAKQLRIENSRTLYAMINVAASWGLYGGPVNIAPLEAWNRLWKTDLWREKQKYKFDRAKRGYSEYGSLNYPCCIRNTT